MRRLGVWTARLSGLFFRRRREAELQEEVRLHLEMQAEDNERTGMSPDQARFAAMRSFGGTDQMKEEYRDQSGVPIVLTLWRDLRHAARVLRRSPGFSFIALATLAIGIGAGTAVFSVVNAVLLRSLPVRNPHELRLLQWTGTDVRLRSFDGDSTEVGNRQTGDAISPPLFLSLREKAAGLADIFAFAPLNDVAARARREARASSGMVVSDNFFSGLGVRPFIGRLFVPGNIDADTAQQVVISADWWEGEFARDLTVVGQTVALNGASFTIIGVLPRDFPGVRAGDHRAFYVLMAPASQFLEAAMTDADFWWVRPMARLRPGVGDAQLKAALDLVFPREAKELMKAPEMLVKLGRGGPAFDRDKYRRPLFLMLGVVGLVLAVTCANLAGLSLARGAARQPELAVRAALGAGRWQLIRQSLAESFVLALLGGVLGLLGATWGKEAISSLLAGSVDGLRYDLSLDLAVLGFGLVVTLVTAVLSGVLPAWRAGRVDPLDGLKARGALDRSRLRVGRVLVAGQIALSLLLSCGAGLFLRTVSNLRNIDAGFDTDRLLLFQLRVPRDNFNAAQRTALYERVQDTLAAIPGVRGATLLMHPLLDNESWSGTFTLPGRAVPSPADLHTSRLIVSETFFATMGIPVLQGRGLSAADGGGAPKAIVINETFANTFLPHENPLGHTVNFLNANWRIVGVSRDSRHRSIKEVAAPVVYLSFRQFSVPGTSVALRTALPPLALANAVRMAVAAIDPQVPVAHLTTQEELRDESIGQERLFATLCGVLAGLALLLSCLGLYGLMAYHVTRRTPEIAIRMALGGQPGEVSRPILGEALALAAIGIGVGLPGVWTGSRLIRSQLFGIEPHDPATLAAVIVFLATVSLVGAWLPARRATRVSPLIALRD